MDALQTRSAQIAPGMFLDFVRYLDRGERTTQTYLTNLRQFAAWIRRERIRQPQRDDILSYRDFLLTEHDAILFDPKEPDGWRYRTDRNGNRIRISCRPNTVAQYLRSVCQFFRWTAACGYYPNIADNIHAPKIRHDRHQKEALGALDVLRIEESLRNGENTEKGKRLLAMYLLAVNAGLRTIEIERANVKDLQLRGGTAFLYVWGKGHSEADTRKPIAPEVYAAIKDYLSSRSDRITGSSPLFVSTGNRSGGKRIAARTISGMLKDALRAAGYDSERITAHSLRHTAGTCVQEITGNLYITQKYMRHSNPATTEIYLHNNTEKEEAETAQRLYKYYHEGKRDLSLSAEGRGSANGL